MIAIGIILHTYSISVSIYVCSCLTLITATLPRGQLVSVDVSEYMRDSPGDGGVGV